MSDKQPNRSREANIAYQNLRGGYQPVAGPLTGTPTPPTGGSGIKPPPASKTSNKS